MLAGIDRSGPRDAEVLSEELLTPWADQIFQWLTAARMQVTRIRELLGERGVQYVRERFFKGSTFTSLAPMRGAARRWCLEVAGLRVHGITRRQPLQVFLDEERPAQSSPASKEAGHDPHH